MFGERWALAHRWLSTPRITATGSGPEYRWAYAQRSPLVHSSRASQGFVDMIASMR